METVAIIGLGIMGRGMARNFIEHGHRVVVWNRTTGRADDLAAHGARVAASPAEAAAEADLVFEVTADDASSRAVWLGQAGILAGARPGATLVASATLSVDWVAELAEECERRGRLFFDMPLTGGRAGAEAGQLVLLAGGDAGRLDPLRPVLCAIAKDVRHFGPVGAGTRFKLILNALQALHLAGFGEAMRLARSAGLDPEAVGAALVERPGGVVTELAWQHFRQPPAEVSFPVAWALKDLTYAAAMAGPTPHPLLEDLLAMFDRARREGHADADWSTVNRLDPKRG